MHPDETLRFIPCLADGETFFVKTNDVARMARAEEISPGDQESGIVGWLESTGVRVPVMRFRFSEIFPARTSRVVVLNSSKAPWGLVVDEVSPAIEIANPAMRPLPHMLGETARRLFSGVIVIDGGLTLLVSPDALSTAATERPETPVAMPELGYVASVRSTPRHAANLIVFRLEESVGFGDDNVALGLSASQVLEVIQTPRVTRVPGSPPHLRGIVYWRNKVLPVMDASLRLGLSGKSGETPERLVVVAGVDGQPPVALTASRDVRMLRVPLDQPCAPGLEQFPMIKAAVEVGSQTLIVPNLRRMFAA